MNAKTWRPYPFVVVCLLFATPCLILASVAFVTSWRAISGAGRTKGTVIKMVWGGGRSSAPVIRYVVAGKAYEIVAESGSRPRVYSPGDEVVICYNPHRPGEGRLDSFGELWLGPLILLGVGLIFATFAVLVWLYGVDPKDRDQIVPI